jgi:hypothetical protein
LGNQSIRQTLTTFLFTKRKQIDEWLVKKDNKDLKEIDYQSKKRYLTVALYLLLFPTFQLVSQQNIRKKSFMVSAIFSSPVARWKVSDIAIMFDERIFSFHQQAFLCP